MLPPPHLPKRGAPFHNTNRLIHGRYRRARIARRKEVMRLVHEARTLLHALADKLPKTDRTVYAACPMSQTETGEEPHTAEAEAARKLFAGPCDFFWAAASADNLPPATLPEIAFVGRSNVGKSSLINALTGRKSLARVSRTPGRTREINFFNLGGKLILADLPGYGYAKASKTLAAEWQKLIFAYLRGRPTLKRVALLIDARRGIGETDRAVMELLDKTAVSYLLVLTKLDEMKEADAAQILETTLAQSRKHVAAYPAVEATSALKGLGLEALRCHLAALATL